LFVVVVLSSSLRHALFAGLLPRFAAEHSTLGLCWTQQGSYGKSLCSTIKNG